jgi:hypothetical protein
VWESFSPKPGTGEINLDPLLVDPSGLDFTPGAGSPCVDTAHPDYIDPDGTRCDMGSWHYPFISVACSPDDMIVAPGQNIELALVAVNELSEESFPVQVEIIAELPDGAEYLLFGPFPATGVAIPAQSTRDGVVRLRVPNATPEGFQTRLKSVLSNAGTGDYVHQDYCNVTVSSR